MTEILIDAIQRQKCRNNFKNFLYLVFKHINLPSPTEIQYAIADELQNRESDLILNGCWIIEYFNEYSLLASKLSQLKFAKAFLYANLFFVCLCLDLLLLFIHSVLSNSL